MSSRDRADPMVSRNHHHGMKAAESDRRLKRAAMDGSGTVSTAGAVVDADTNHGGLITPENDGVLITVPVEALDVVFEFLDGNGLLSCETVSCQWRLATDRTYLWKRACLSAFPHLKDVCVESAYVCCGAYEGDWRETYLDGNRCNRSAVLDWKMEGMGPGTAGGDVDAEDDGGDGESARRRFPPFRLCGYSFTLLADPGGNPRAADQAEAAGAPRIEKGLSVYLGVIFPEESPDTPPWGDGFAFAHPFPPPPLQIGPGHPWNGSVVEVVESEVDGDEASEVEKEGNGGLVHDSVVENGAAVASEKMTAVSESGSIRPAARVDASIVRRDPHGLRWRRRRFRKREGRLHTFASRSHVGDEAVISRECCAAFSLSAVNRGERKDVTWVSSMDGDRFYPGRRSWGVHCLLPTSVMQDPQEGFLSADGSLTVRLRVRLLFLVLHVYTTSDLVAHRGFGVVNVRATENPEHYFKSKYDDTVFDGSLPCLAFEVLQCTSLEELEKMVARALGGVAPSDIRLWVITQPYTDAPLAPRELLSADSVSVRAIDDGQESPSLQRLLTGDMVDDTCRVRLWVEQRRDGGFWEAEKDHPRLQMPIGLGRPRRPTKQESFGGVRLTCMSEMPPWDMQQPLLWGAAGGEAFHPNISNGQQSVAAAAEIDMGMDDDELVIESEEGDALGAAGMAAEVGDGNSNSAGTSRDKKTRILVFLKTVGFGNTIEAGTATAAPAVRHRDVGDADSVGSGSRSNTWGPKYLTHAILRPSSPLRSLFELAADRLRDGTRPEDLEAYLEDLPCAWQDNAWRDATKEQQQAKATQAGQDDEMFLPERLSEKEFITPKSDVRRCQSRLDRASPTSPPVVCTCGSGSSSSSSSGSSSSSSHVSSYSSPKEAHFISPKSGGRKYQRFFRCPGAAQQGSSVLQQQQHAAAALSLEEAGIAPGAAICFYRRDRTGSPGGGEAMVRRVYRALTEELVEDMRRLLRGEGPLGRVQLIKLPQVVEMCESLGYQGFRARIAHDQQHHVNARETLEYVARGRHLAFICDSCGQQDFCGPRFHCTSCPDYDMCERCRGKVEPAPRHRYLFADGRWKREGGFHGHSPDHELEEMLPVPAVGCSWRGAS